MSGIAAAAITAGAAVVGGAMQARGARKAADTAGAASDRQLAYLKESEDRARNDINTLTPQAIDAAQQGYQNQLDLYKQSIPMTMDMFGQGNMNAQNTIAGSAPQAANAILGGPVNFDFMQPQAVNYDISGLLSNVPDVWQQPQQQQQQQQAVPNIPFRGDDPRAGFQQGPIGQMGGMGGSSGNWLGMHPHSNLSQYLNGQFRGY